MVIGVRELVTGVVQELLLGVERALQPVEHRVDGPGQLGDVVRAGYRDPRGEIGVRDRLGGLVEQSQRPQQPARDDPPAQPDQHQRGERERGVQPGTGREPVQSRLEADRRHEGADLALPGHPDLDRDVAQRTVGLAVHLADLGRSVGGQRRDVSDQGGLVLDREGPVVRGDEGRAAVDHAEQHLTVGRHVLVQLGLEQFGGRGRPAVAEAEAEAEAARAVNVATSPSRTPSRWSTSWRRSNTMKAAPARPMPSAASSSTVVRIRARTRSSSGRSPSGPADRRQSSSSPEPGSEELFPCPAPAVGSSLGSSAWLSTSGTSGTSRTRSGPMVCGAA